MDKRKKYIVVLDTETCPIDRTLDKVLPNNMLVYDIGYTITDKKGNIYLKRSFLVDDIFNQEQEKMASAYYASKIPQYIERLEKGLIELKSFSSIRWQLMQDMKEFNCQTLSAHNARFDIGALNQTARYLNKGWYYLPKEIIVWDSLKMSRDTICKNKTYQYRTSKGFKSATAENLYKYLSGDENFNESHTALEDAIIETKILAKCLSSHKRMRKKLYEDQKRS